MTITIDGGGNAGEGATVGDGSRALFDGDASYVPYEVYSTSGTSSPYSIGAPSVAVLIGTPGEPFVLPILAGSTKEPERPRGRQLRGHAAGHAR